MREFHNNYLNKKLYYKVTSLLSILMVLGLFIDNFNYQHLELGFYLHAILVIILSLVLFLYPRFETHIFRTIIVIISTIFIYILFFLYPETFSLFTLICVIPAFSILFFDSKLFYFSIILNAVLFSLSYSFIVFSDVNDVFSYVKTDVIGNIITFLSTQIILFFIFYLSFDRIKKQQIYYEQVQHSERIKTVGQLTAAVAHEIRNPLTVVKGFLQLYEKDPAINKDAKGHFSLMIDELKTAEHVISQFLTIAKPNNEDKMDTIDVKDALQNITDLLKSFGDLHNNAISLNVESNCCIAVNIIEFKQLFINFIKNAIEASDEGKAVIVNAKRNGNFIEIKVIDRGCGMSKEELKSLGTPFYSLKSKGTGLGLMICFNIVEKYNGTLHFDSTKDEGTTVVVRFPVCTKSKRVY